MRRISAGIRADGFRTHNWCYNSRFHRLDEHIDGFRDFLGDLGESEAAIHFVGHSFGSLVIRGASSKPLPIEPGRIVMIAPPNSGARIAERLGHSAAARWFYGKPIRDLGKGSPLLDQLGLPRAEYGIIAGSGRFHLLNPASWINAFADKDLEHDGTVEVENTRLPGMLDFMVVPANHTFICNHPETIRQTINFLRHGSFEHPASAPAPPIV